jgi:hypothetical protein
VFIYGSRNTNNETLILRRCFPDQFGGEPLSLAISTDELREYRATSLPILGGGTPLLPRFNVGPGGVDAEGGRAFRMGSISGRQRATHGGESRALGTQALAHRRDQSYEVDITDNGIPDPAQGEQVISKELYWCIPQAFTEPQDIELRPIPTSGDRAPSDDRDLYQQTNPEIYRPTRSVVLGWLLRLASWERCTKVRFVEVLFLPALIRLILDDDC